MNELTLVLGDYVELVGTLVMRFQKLVEDDTAVGVTEVSTVGQVDVIADL